MNKLFIASLFMFVSYTNINCTVSTVKLSVRDRMIRFNEVKSTSEGGERVIKILENKIKEITDQNEKAKLEKALRLEKVFLNAAKGIIDAGVYRKAPDKQTLPSSAFKRLPHPGERTLTPEETLPPSAFERLPHPDERTLPRKGLERLPHPQEGTLPRSAFEALPR